MSELAEETGHARQGDIGYVSLWVPDVTKAAAFYGHVLGWSYQAGSVPDGRQIEDIRPHHGIFGGQASSTLFVCYLVDDVDAAVARVEAAGGSSEPPTNEPYGRVAVCKDNQGMALGVYEAPAGESPARWAQNGERAGDISYVTLHVQDSALARQFYASVLGWKFQPGRVEDGWGTEDVAPMIGLAGGHEHGVAAPMYRVDDIESAVARVRAAGGTSTDPVAEPYGFMVECHDDQGTHFWLGQH